MNARSINARAVLYSGSEIITVSLGQGTVKLFSILSLNFINVLKNMNHSRDLMMQSEFFLESSLFR